MKPLIIDAACFCSRPFQSPEANYLALLGVSAKLLKCGATFMCILDRKVLEANATSRWSLRIMHFTSVFPFWFFWPLAGADVVEEIKRASASLNANIISSRLPLTLKSSMQFEVEGGVMLLRRLNLRVGIGQPFETVADNVKRRLLHNDRYKRHVVALAAASVVNTQALDIAA